MSTNTLDYDYNEIIYSSNLAWLKLDVEFPHEKIYKEILSLESYFYDHTETKGGSKEQKYAEGIQGWKSLGLHGISATETSQSYRYGFENEDDAPYKWTGASEKCPETISAIKKILPSNKYYRIKINKMEPGGIIPPHNDSDISGLGISAHTSPEHVTYVTIPIYWPEEVYFYLPIGKRIPVKNGEPLLLDYSCDHEVISKSSEDRYFILVSADFRDQDSWKKLVVNSYSKNKNLSPERPKFKKSSNLLILLKRLFRRIFR